ncbi:conserved hypothetical protein [Pseudomonas soli]
MHFGKCLRINISKNALTAYACMHNLYLKPVSNRLLHRQR